MLQLLELIPILTFFATYKMSGQMIDIAGIHYQLDGIYSATAVLMATTTAQVLITCIWKRKIEKRFLWLLATVLILGSATLLFHNQLFIQWKPTIFNWVFGIILIGSHLFTNKNVIQRMLGEQLQLPDTISTRLTYLWSMYFFIVGALNLFVAYHFSEQTWVSYKLWSFIAYTLIISIITALIVSPHLKVETSNNDRIE